MSMNDPIADLLTRIRNAQMVGLRQTSMPHSKIKEAIVHVLVEEGYVESFDVTGEMATKTLRVDLKYKDGEPAIRKIKRVSTPGCRSYSAASDIPTVCGALGTMIVTTSLGVMTGRQAKAKNVGGELLCEVF